MSFKMPKIKLTKEKVWLTITIIYCIAIFITTGSPSSTGDTTSSILQKIFKLSDQTAVTVNFVFRKSVHFFAYGLLAILFYKSFIKSPYLKAWLFTTLYAISDEVHQAFLPGRTGSVKDVFIDSLGAIIALLLVKVIVNEHENNSKRKARSLE